MYCITLKPKFELTLEYDKCITFTNAIQINMAKH